MTMQQTLYQYVQCRVGSRLSLHYDLVTICVRSLMIIDLKPKHYLSSRVICIYMYMALPMYYTYVYAFINIRALANARLQKDCKYSSDILNKNLKMKYAA